jgi:hypothetical protein
MSARTAIEAQRARLYELESVLRAGRRAAEAGEDVVELLGLGARIVGEVNDALDAVNLGEAVVAVADATALPPAALDARQWLSVAAQHLGQARTALNTAFEEAVPDSDEEREARDARESVEIAYGIVKAEGAQS